MSHSEARVFYEFFGRVVSECPSELQGMQMSLMFQINQIISPLGNNTPDGPIEKDFAELIQSVYQQTKNCFQIMEVRIHSQTAEFVSDVELNLTQGLVSHYIIELNNETEETLRILAFFDPAPTPSQKSFFINPGCKQPQLASLEVEDYQKKTADLVIASASKQYRIPIPIKIGTPAILKGKLLDENNEIFPGKVVGKGSDHRFRFSQEYIDNDTVTRKPLLGLWGYDQKLPFFYCDGTFQVDVPEGTTEITLERGFEHEIITRQISVAAGEVCEATFSSRRLINMRSLGWISGDTHVHWTKNHWYDDEAIDLLDVVQRAEDIQVINNLTLRHMFPAPAFDKLSPTQYPMGPVPDRDQGEYLIQMAEEYRNQSCYGHLIFLGIKELLQPVSTGPGLMQAGFPDYPPNLPAMQEALRQGGIILIAHGLIDQSPADIALGLVESIDQVNAEDYYEILDAGYRLAVTNGSDHPARVTGVVRAYVKVENPMSYQGWLDGIKAAKTFTTSGPLFLLQVNGKDPGEEVHLTQGEALQVKAQVISRHPVGRFQVVYNHKIVKDVEISGNEGTFEFDIPAEESGWIIARAAATPAEPHWNALFGTDIGHTSAIYITTVDGKPVFHPEAAQKLVDRLIRQQEYVEKNGVFENEKQKEEGLFAIREGIRVLRKRIGDRQCQEPTSQ